LRKDIRNKSIAVEYELKDHKIMTMEEEKRRKVISAALKEFTKGYDAANMDHLAAEAGISKGLVFHYFGNKKGLYYFLLKYCAEIMDAEYSRVILKDRDFLENIRMVSRLALEMTFKFPDVYAFIGKAVFSINQVFPEGLPKDLPNSNQTLLVKILTLSDKTLFRDDIDSRKVQNIVLWTIKGFSDSIMSYGSDIADYQKNSTAIMKEFEEYIEVLRKLIYKP
jgi:AcrR family transcriptional regulator